MVPELRSPLGLAPRALSEPDLLALLAAEPCQGVLRGRIWDVTSGLGASSASRCATAESAGSQGPPSFASLTKRLSSALPVVYGCVSRLPFLPPGFSAKARSAQSRFELV